MATKLQQDDELDKLEEDIRKLKNAYDQFFAGITKVPPMTARRVLEAGIHEMNRKKMRDSGRRFRFQQLVTRFNQFRELWGRRMREREEGPMEFKRRQAAIAGPAEVEVQRHVLSATSPRVTSGDADPYVRVAAGTNGEEVRKLYEQIQSEHTRMGKASNVTFEQLSEMVQKQSEMVRSRYNVDAVAFRVETVEGKVKLKAKPIQEK
jgi:hypothetical protein